MNATDLDTHILSDLDFTPTLPCEYSKHAQMHHADGPAEWVAVRATATCCGQPKRLYLICDEGRRNLIAAGYARCTGCGVLCSVSERLMFLPIGGHE